MWHSHNSLEAEIYSLSQWASSVRSRACKATAKALIDLLEDHSLPCKSSLTEEKCASSGRYILVECGLVRLVVCYANRISAGRNWSTDPWRVAAQITVPKTVASDFVVSQYAIDGIWYMPIIPTTEIRSATISIKWHTSFYHLFHRRWDLVRDCLEAKLEAAREQMRALTRVR